MTKVKKLRKCTFAEQTKDPSLETYLSGSGWAVSVRLVAKVLRAAVDVDGQALRCCRWPTAVAVEIVHEAPGTCGKSVALPRRRVTHHP